MECMKMKMTTGEYSKVVFNVQKCQQSESST